MRVPCLKVSPIDAENKREMRYARHKSCVAAALAEEKRSCRGIQILLRCFLSERDAFGPRKGLQAPLIQFNLSAPSFSPHADDGQ
jgi:hypothetical protein